MRNTEPSRDRRRIALVAVEELDDGLGLAEGADSLLDPRHVDRVEEENPSADLERVRRPREEVGLGPAEAALELVTALEDQSPRNV
jgi:hypothetical protein